MHFGEAFQHLIQGQIIKRPYWIMSQIKMSGDYLINPFSLPINNETTPNGQLVTRSMIRRPNGEWVEDWKPYTLSNDDLFANDWEIVQIPNLVTEILDDTTEEHNNNPVQAQENEEVFYILKPKKLKLKEDNQIVDMDFQSMYSDDHGTLPRMEQLMNKLTDERYRFREMQRFADSQRRHRIQQALNRELDQLHLY